MMDFKYILLGTGLLAGRTQVMFKCLTCSFVPLFEQVIEASDKNRVCAEYWNSRPLAQISQCFQTRGNPNSKSEDTNVGGSDSILRGLFKKATPEELHSLMQILGNDHNVVTRVINEMENLSR